jgi:diamine N-acetyltransferase
MAVELREITKDNWRQVVKLPLNEGQEKLVAPNWYSLLEAFYEPENVWVKAAYDGDTMVGFTLFDYDSEDTKAYWVGRLMVSAEHQRRGYGRAIMQQVIDILSAKPDCTEIYISFEPHNHVARALYTSLGFQDTGKIMWDELVFRLPIEK